MQIFPAGVTHGNDGRGPYALENAEAVIAASVRPAVELVIDRDHVTDLAAPGAERRAAGWIKELQARDGSIWARVEWTPPAQEQLRNKEYRYISPTFMHSKDGKVHQILRASLTNDPNFEMKAVAAADRESTSTQTETETMDEFLQTLAALLGLEGDAISQEAVAEAVKTLVDTKEAVKEAVDAPVEADTPEAIVQAVETHVEQEVEKEVASRQKKATASKVDLAKYVPIGVVKELQEQVAELTNDAAQAKATAAVDAALKAGKILPAQKEWALALASKDAKAFDDYAASAPSVLNGGARLKGHPPAGNTGLTENQLATAAKLGVTAEQYAAQIKKTNESNA